MIEINLVTSKRHEMGRNGKVCEANVSSLMLDTGNTVDVS